LLASHFRTREIYPMKKSVPVLVLLSLLLAGSATAELAETYREWRSGPVQHLMLPADEAAWEKVRTDEDAEAFIRLFWARRDPTPGTALNEYRRDFEQRAAFADERFKSEEERGSMTDQGQVFILLGPPNRIQRPGAGGTATGGDFGSIESSAGGGGSVSTGGGSGTFTRGGATERLGVASEERWVYEDENRPEFVSQKRFTVRFLTKPGSDEVELRSGEQALGYMAEAKRVALVSPDLTADDLASMGGGGSAAAAAAAGETMAWMGEEVSGPDAVSALRAALGDGGGAVAAHLDAGAFQASDGRWIIPYQVSTAADPGAADARVVGELVSAGTDEQVLAFRLDQSWTESRGQRYAKDTLVVPPGDYELRVGLEQPDGTVSWAAREAVEVPAASDEFWLSELIFSDNVYPMDEAQEMLEPYAWQGIVVVPQGDRTFAQGSVMWFYVHACRPVLTAEGEPSLRVTAKIEGPQGFRGQVPVQPARAGDDCWVIAQGLDLAPAQFPAGDYEMALQVRDSEGQKTLSSKESFTVVAQ
jgi:GWxTD domain-containing protein